MIRPVKMKASRKFISHAGWRTIGGKKCYFRSKMEANWARYLEFSKKGGLILDWEHEPKTFWFEGIKRGCVSYLPDFQVFKFNGSHWWVEVKGYMDEKSMTKIKRFRKYFPNEVLEVVDKHVFDQKTKFMHKLIMGWEL